ncbi:MAG TPA: hypothetical protein VN253_16180, partial [Kofleriaceae bacterium]|nr:hypothetical protein [Kofleriaceae bacterium]
MEPRDAEDAETCDIAGDSPEAIVTVGDRVTVYRRIRRWLDKKNALTAFTSGEYKRSDLHRYLLNTEHTPMRTVGSGLVCLALAAIAGAACTDTDSATNLNPEGPPMIRQVRLVEHYLDSSMIERTRRVFAFGT